MPETEKEKRQKMMNYLNKMITVLGNLPKSSPIYKFVRKEAQRVFGQSYMPARYDLKSITNRKETGSYTGILDPSGMNPVPDLVKAYSEGDYTGLRELTPEDYKQVVSPFSPDYDKNNIGKTYYIESELGNDSIPREKMANLVAYVVERNFRNKGIIPTNKMVIDRVNAVLNNGEPFSSSFTDTELTPILDEKTPTGSKFDIGGFSVTGVPKPGGNYDLQMHDRWGFNKGYEKRYQEQVWEDLSKTDSTVTKEEAMELLKRQKTLANMLSSSGSVKLWSRNPVKRRYTKPPTYWNTPWEEKTWGQ